MSDSRFISRAFCLTLALGLAGTAGAQDRNQPDARIANLAGPRFGITVLSGSITDKLKKERTIDVGPVITQFGWQAETRFGVGQEGFAGVSEVVVLAGGLEQGQFLPSLSWIVGFRTADGVEIGAGPNVTPISASLAFVGGVTNTVAGLNVPLNVAIVPSSAGVRISVLSGFNVNK